MRLFASNSSKTYIKNSIKRQSKRYGTTPWIKIKKKSKILIAIDTSWSIEQKELNIFFNEVSHIFKQWVEIYVVECDCKIQKSYKYDWSSPKIIKWVWWTSFNAPIQFSNDIYKPDALIYFTDWYACTPDVLSRYPILWMITKEGIEINKEESEKFDIPKLEWRIVKMT